jgi:hypothetical protein
MSVVTHFTILSTSITYHVSTGEHSLWYGIGRDVKLLFSNLK